MRRTFGFPLGTQVLSLFRADADLKAHPRYRLAKEGDETAALDLVIDLAVPWLFANGHRFSNVPCIFVAPHAKEASGDNAIPQTLAAVCAAVLKGSTGSALRGSESAGLLKKKFHSVLASGLGLLAGRGWVLRKRPPAYWGESG